MSNKLKLRIFKCTAALIGIIAIAAIIIDPLSSFLGFITFLALSRALAAADSREYQS